MRIKAIVIVPRESLNEILLSSKEWSGINVVNVEDPMALMCIGTIEEGECIILIPASNNVVSYANFEDSVCKSTVVREINMLKKILSIEEEASCDA